jgi:hypothetical protein
LRTPKFRTIAVAMGVALLAAAAIAQAEVEQKGTIRVTFDGKLTPKTLPRTGVAPVKVSVGAKIAPTSPTAEPPQLTKMSIAINKYGVIDSTGLPACQLDDIQPSTTADALAVCKRSLVGEGTFSANVPDSGRSPFPASGKLYAFSGKLDGKPAILAHVYGTEPAPITRIIVFHIRTSAGTYGTVLSASVPESVNQWGYLTHFNLSLHRSFTYRGRRRSYLSAACAAPVGFSEAVFPFAHAAMSFVGGRTLASTLTRGCKVKN